MYERSYLWTRSARSRRFSETVTSLAVAGASGTWDTVRWVLGIRSARFFLALFLTWSLRVTLDSRVVEEQSYAMQLCQVRWKSQADRSLGSGLQTGWFISACPVVLLDAGGCGCAFAAIERRQKYHSSVLCLDPLA